MVEYLIKIKTDSRKIEKGDIFVAIKGKNYDGHDYILEAKEKGAKCAIVEHYTNSHIAEILVEDSNKWLQNYLEETYKETIDSLNIIGVTGTNGKTTTSYLTYELLNALGSKTAYIGTIGYYIPGEKVEVLENTTPSIRDLYDLLVTAKEKGCVNVVMEVSSHALDQERIKGIRFKVGAFTNLTQDHLDYHKTMEDYFAAKKKILEYLGGPLVVNTDDAYGRRLDESYDKTITLGYFARDLKILDYKETERGTYLTFLNDCGVYEVETNLKAKFNVYNYLTAVGLVKSLGYRIEDIINVTDKVYAPKGRCEQIRVKNGTVIIDYAHTPDAVAKIIKTFAENKSGRLITLIGCGGDRDKKKRSIMGGIATEFSDYVIFTSDNPRTEDPEKIILDMLRWVSKDNYKVILNRKEAIYEALDMIIDNDTVLLLGKGHEDYQIIGHTKYHLDDKEEVNNYKLALEKK